MAKKAKTSRGRNQDRARVAGGQDYEVRYEAKKKITSRAAVKKAVKKVGNSRKKVERALSRWTLDANTETIAGGDLQFLDWGLYCRVGVWRFGTPPTARLPWPAHELASRSSWPEVMTRSGWIRVVSAETLSWSELGDTVHDYVRHRGADERVSHLDLVFFTAMRTGNVQCFFPRFWERFVVRGDPHIYWLACF
jgi:hypothetical protein